MFFKRLGVLKTRDMNNKMEILNRLPFYSGSEEGKSLERLKGLLCSNQAYTEVLKHIEDLSKQALDVFNKKHDSVRLFDSGIIKLNNVNDIIVNDFFGKLGLQKDPEVERLVYNAVYNHLPDNEKYVVNITGQNKTNIEKLHRNAKMKKSEMKDLQKNIYDNLEKYVKLYPKAKALHDKIKKSPLGKLTDSGPDKDRKKLSKLTEQFNDLRGGIVEIRGKVEKLLEKTGTTQQDCKKAVEFINYPKLTKEETEAEVNRLSSYEEVFQTATFKGSAYYIGMFKKEDGVKRCVSFKEFIKENPKHVIEKYDGKFTIDGKSVKNYCEALKKEKEK